MKTTAKTEAAALTAKEFDSWFDHQIGLQIRDFLMKMAGEVLTGEWAKRIGVNLSVEGRDESSGGNLKRLVYISRSESPRYFNKKQYGFEGQANCYYALTMAEGDGDDCWHQMELFSLEMTHVPPAASENAQTYVRDNFKITRVNGQHVVVLDEASPHQALKLVDNWCRMRSNGILYLEAAGARKKSSLAPDMYVHEHTVRFKNPGGWCSAFSVFNGLCCIIAFEDVRKVSEMTAIVTTKDMKDLENWVRTLTV